jgi:hypothetical protein
MWGRDLTAEILFRFRNSGCCTQGLQPLNGRRACPVTSTLTNINHPNACMPIDARVVMQMVKLLLAENV